MPAPEPPRDPHRRADRSVEEAARRRDQGRRRVKNTTRWVVAATVAGTAALGAGYAHAIPGGPTKPAPTTPPATAPPGNTGSPGTPDRSPTSVPSHGGGPAKPHKSSGGLRTPTHPPTRATKPPHTTSGGS